MANTYPNAKVVGPAGAATQASGVATNIPSAVTDGMELPPSCSGVRATVAAASGKTLNGTGLLVWWVFNPDLGLWTETPVQENVVAGRQASAGTELPIRLKTGYRVYVEARNVDTSDASDVTVQIARE